MLQDISLAELLSGIFSGMAMVATAIIGIMLRRHHHNCNARQENYVPRDEHNGTINSLRDEIAKSYRHIELRIDEGNRTTHERIDRLIEKMK